MANSTTWSICGIDTMGSALTLSQLLPWGRDGALVPQSVSCNFPAAQGDISNVLTADSASVTFDEASVRASSFAITFTFAHAVEVWGFRFAGPSAIAWPFRHAVRPGLPACTVGAVAWHGVDVLSPAPTAALNFSEATGVWSTRLAGGFRNWKSCVLSADGQIMLASQYSGSLWLSKDGGITWAEQTGAGAYTWVGLAMSADGLVCIALPSYGPLRITVDGGATWQSVAATGSKYWKGCAVSADGMTLLVGDNNSGALWLSKDKGSSWVSQAAPGQNSWVACAASEDGKVLLGAVYNGAMWVSKDAGETWTAKTAGNLSWTHCAISGDGATMLAVGSGDYPRLSKTTGDSWTQLTGLGVKTWQGCGVSGDGAVLLAGAQSAAMQMSTDGGATWVAQFDAGALDWTGCAVSRSGTTLAAVGYSGGAYPWMLLLPDPIYVAAPIRHLLERSLVIGAPEAPAPQGAMALYVSGAPRVKDMEFGGEGCIYGTVGRKGTPVNNPLARRVRLHRSRDGLLVRETWSHADGSYEFSDISLRYEYDVIAWDHEMQDFSTVANNQLAEPML